MNPFEHLVGRGLREGSLEQPPRPTDRRRHPIRLTDAIGFEKYSWAPPMILAFFKKMKLANLQPPAVNGRDVDDLPDSDL